MLSISRKVGYGLELLTVLAKLGQGKTVPLNQLTKTARLPYRFTSQVAISLKEAGILGSKEGVGGGYYLKKKPGKVTITQVIRILEGRKGIVACMVEGNCRRQCFCQSKPVWQQIQNDVFQIMKEYNLADLVRESKDA